MSAPVKQTTSEVLPRPHRQPVCIITIIIAHIIITRALSITKRAGCQRVYGESRRGTRSMTVGDKNTINWHTTFGYVVRTIVPSLLLEYGLHEARVRRRPLLVELRDLLAQLSLPLAFKFAAVAPTPVQNTCSHGSADDEKMEGGMRSARVGDRSGVRVDETGARFSRKTRVPDGDARVGPRTAPGARAAARETNPKPNWRARVASGGRASRSGTHFEGGGACAAR